MPRTATTALGVAALAVVALTAASCGAPDAADVAAAGTPALRAALFDTILARTARREAFSAVKNRRQGFDPLAEMEALRDEVVSAVTPEDLFYALEHLSNARRDRHLQVALVPGGITPSDPSGLEGWGVETPAALQAPLRIRPDYGPDGGYFVADLATDVKDGPPAGARVVRIQGMDADAFAGALRPWVRASTPAGLRWKTADLMTQRSGVVPPSLRRDRLEIEVEGADGAARSYAFAYRDPDSITWRRLGEPAYPGYAPVRSTPTWDLLLPDDGRRVVVLRWYGFRETLVADVDTLLAEAERRGLLDHALIIDVTRSRGGSRGAYALQRLQPRAFRTTFGTLRLSDVIEPFVEEKRREWQARSVNDGGTPETIDDGTWLMDWLEHDVLDALARGDSVTEPVPFKLAHAPKDSDGVLRPAPVHFRGPLVVLSGPQGGSHLDQFNAIVKDNRLGPIVGMPAGGYSNTWEWEETLTFPGTDRPVVGWMWSIGHTIRPDGEVLEGNPAEVDLALPLTAANATEYYRLLYDAALRLLREAGFDPAG